MEDITDQVGAQRAKKCLESERPWEANEFFSLKSHALKSFEIKIDKKIYEFKERLNCKITIR